MDWEEADTLPELPKLDTVRYEYNQGAQDWSKKSCTIFSPMWALSDYLNREWTLAELKEPDDLSYTLWRTKDKGWYVKSWVDCVCKWYNSHSDWVKKYGKAMYKYIPTSDEETINKLLAKNYAVCTGFNGNTKWMNDYYYDARLDWTTFGTSTFGHAVSLVYKNLKRHIKDNYKGRTGQWKIPNNYYEVVNEPRKIQWWHTWCYVIYLVKEDHSEEIKRCEWIKAKCNTIIPLLWELYNSVNDKAFQNKMHETADLLRKKIEDANRELEKYK